MGNIGCCRNNSSFLEIAGENLINQSNYMLPIDLVRNESPHIFFKQNEESPIIYLTEWSTSERLTKIQKIKSKNMTLLVKNNENLCEVLITPRGIEPQIREIQDGAVFFGCRKKDAKGNTVVDYVCELKNKHLSKKYRGPHFMVYFDIVEHEYYLHDLALGFGIFVKIKDAIRLRNDFLFSIGESLVLVNLIHKNDKDDFPRLRLKVFRNDCSTEVFYFCAQEYVICNIKIGRGKSCHVNVNDNMVSKLHASMFFTTGKEWMLADGDCEKGSTNGTWLYASYDIKLDLNIEFKACESIFKVIKL